MSDCLPARSEEDLQQLGGAGLTDAAIDFRRMMAGWLGKEARAVLDGTAFRIWRAEIEPADARKGDGRGAHAAWFERDIQVAADEPLAAEPGTSLPDRQQLGMGGGIVGAERPIAGAGQHLAGWAHQHGADRNLAQKPGGLSAGMHTVYYAVGWRHSYLPANDPEHVFYDPQGITGFPPGAEAMIDSPTATSKRMTLVV